jgi:hypothetical protein
LIEPVIASAQCWLLKPLLTERLFLILDSSWSDEKDEEMASSRAVPCRM